MENNKTPFKTTIYLSVVAVAAGFGLASGAYAGDDDGLSHGTSTESCEAILYMVDKDADGDGAADKAEIAVDASSKECLDSEVVAKAKALVATANKSESGGVSGGGAPAKAEKAEVEKKAPKVEPKNNEIPWWIRAKDAPAGTKTVDPISGAEFWN